MLSGGKVVVFLTGLLQYLAKNMEIFFGQNPFLASVCPRSSDPFDIVIYNIKWVTSSWTNSIFKNPDIEI